MIGGEFPIAVTDVLNAHAVIRQDAGYYSYPVCIKEIAAICKEWHIEFVEDAAESIGSWFADRVVNISSSVRLK